MAEALDILTIKDSLSKFVVRPLNAFGLGGFVFDIEGDTSVNLAAQITDHYTEDNSAIQDHISINPDRVILRSYVGELVDRRDATTETTLQKVTQKLTILDSYLPAISRGVSQFKQLANNVAKSGLTLSSLSNISLNNVVDLYSLTKNLSPPISKQERAYMYFKALLQGKILVSVQTPFEFHTNMAVESVISTQSENNKYMSDFSITLKKMRIASTQNASLASGVCQLRNGFQKAAVDDKGKTNGAAVPNSFLYDSVIKPIRGF